MPKKRIDLADLRTPLKPLLKAIAASPYNFAPEKKTELKKLQDQHGITVGVDADKQDFHVGIWTLSGRIEIGLPTLERIWAYAYSYVALFPLLQKHGMGKFINLTTEPAVKRARALLLWAHAAEKSGTHVPWPEVLPRPDHPDASDPDLATANTFFLMMVGWILLHEVAHAVLHQDTQKSPIEQEYEADHWASKWVLSDWRKYDPNLKVFIQRSTGIAFALSMLSGIELYGEGIEVRMHPNVADRLLRFLDEFVIPMEQAEGKNLTSLVPISILQLHLMNAGKSLDLTKRYATARDYLLDVRKFFPDETAQG